MRTRLTVLTVLLAFAACLSSVPATGQEPEHVLADDTLSAMLTGAGRPESGGADRLVHVEVLHHTDSATIGGLVADAGGTITGEVPGAVAEGDVPLSALADLEATDEVDFVRTPESISEPLSHIDTAPLPQSPAQPESGFLSEEVAKTHVDTWHRAGFRGAGVRVGIVDVFDQAAWNATRGDAEIEAPAGTFCRIQGSSACSVWGAHDAHGVAVAEVVFDMAPDADVYLAYVETTSDLQAAINWFASNDVDVVTRSLTSPYDGPGDGTGPIDAVMDDATAQGMTVFQAAGNSAGRAPNIGGSYLRWEFADEDHDGWVEFAPGVERLEITCAFLNGLRWDDFGEGAGTTDYDLYLYNGAGTVQRDSSTDAQQSGAPPIERVDTCPTPRAQFAVKVEQPGDAAEGDVLELLMNGSQFDHWTNAGSAGAPVSDSANPDVLSVGAIDPYNGTTAGYYSSQGPTNDGRVKPDLAAASCFASYVASPYCFNGTSASTPVVAGAAAVLLSSDIGGLDSTNVGQWIRDWEVVDRATPGLDQVTGHGELIMRSIGQRPQYKPDASVAAPGHGRIGSNTYNTTGARQTMTTFHAAGATARYIVRVANNGNVPERIVIAGAASVFGFRIQYGGSAAITRRVVDANYHTPILGPNHHFDLDVTVTVPRSARPGDGIRIPVAGISNSNFRTRDVINIVTVRR